MPKLSADLLSQAGALAVAENHKPKQASLRRAVSTAYYALFHCLIEETTSYLIGKGSENAALRDLAARAFVHGKMKDLCLEFSKPIPKSALLKSFWPLEPQASLQLGRLSSSFSKLQQLRHDADYDVGKRIVRNEALDAVEEAKIGIRALADLKNTTLRSFDYFAPV